MSTKRVAKTRKPIKKKKPKAQTFKKKFNFSKKIGDELITGGVKYIIVSKKTLDNPPKIMIGLRRPKGTKLYFSFVSKSGHVSIPVGWN